MVNSTGLTGSQMSWQGIKDIKGNPIGEMKNVAGTAYNSFKTTGYGAKVVDSFQQIGKVGDIETKPLYKGTLFDKGMRKMKLDWLRESVVHTKYGEKLAEKLGAIVSENGILHADATGKFAGVKNFAAKALGQYATKGLGALTVAFEVPEVVSSFKNHGVWEGCKQVVRSSGEAAGSLGGFAAGAMAGQALIPIPIVGAAIGGIVGGLIGEKFGGGAARIFTGEKKDDLVAAQSDPTQLMQDLYNAQYANYSPEASQQRMQFMKNIMNGNYSNY